MVTALKLVPALTLLMTGASFAATPEKEQTKQTLSIDPAHHAEMMAQQKASEQQIESLQKAIENIQKQLESVPRTGESDYRLHE